MQSLFALPFSNHEMTGCCTGNALSSLIVTKLLCHQPKLMCPALQILIHCETVAFLQQGAGYLQGSNGSLCSWNVAAVYKENVL